jgi:formylglycine-generating enzyme required for sulfatase activity
MPVDGSVVQSAAACEKRVVRGGSWITRPSRQRVTFRGRDPEDALYSFFGFRLAREL